MVEGSPLTSWSSNSMIKSDFEVQLSSASSTVPVMVISLTISPTSLRQSVVSLGVVKVGATLSATVNEAFAVSAGDNALGFTLLFDNYKFRDKY